MDHDPREEREVEELLRTLDHQPSRTSVEDVIARAEARPTGWGRVAAGTILVLAAAGAAWAVPGSPVRAWVQAVLDGPRSVRPAGAPAAPPAATAIEGGGAVFDPREPLTVSITPHAGGHLRVVMTDDTLLVARMPAGRARFAAEPNRLRVEPFTPDTFELRVPRSAARVEVLAGGRRLFLSERGAVLAGGPADADGVRLMPLDGLRSP